MTTIRISQCDLDTYTDKELEALLQASGKPDGVPCVIQGEEVVTATVVPVEPVEMVADTTPVELAPMLLDYNKMTKEEIEQAVILRHGVNMKTTILKSSMIKKARKLDKEASATA